jgi:hypothetical protein
MPWTNPETFTAGQTLSSASMNIVSGNARMGRAVFTNEAARDAAITAPEEGMIAYLTAPTVPAATGATTAVPTGITTIYNGSAWVCVTPVGANSATDASTTSTSYVTTLTSDSTALSVTLATGTSVFIQYGFAGNVTGPNAYLMTFAVSGATTVLAADPNAVYLATAGVNLTGHRGLIYTGLTAGTNTFTLNYRTTGGTVTYIDRWLVAQGVA